MGYLSLYRKWRPKAFDDLAGQTTVVKTLKNALTNNRIAHAYLFCGPRGTGKTSTAKVFAKALNCEHGPTIEPCNQCFSCEQINSGRSVDVIEIDAASNRRIDEIRDLREKVKFSPSEGDYKVYIIDEVHMLTKEAFNALLKTLEEPPQNVVFILATTEPHKVLPTIISRCQRFDFGLLSVRELKARMKHIAAEEGIAVTDDALTLIARTAEGGMRDAISTLDQAIAFGGEQVTVDDVNTILGKVDQRVLANVVAVISSHNVREALELLNVIVDQGKDINQFIKDLLFHFRDLLLIRECGTANTVIDLPDELKQELAGQAEHFTSKELLNILELLSEADQQLKLTSQPRLLLEMVMIKLTSKEADLTLANLVGRLARLEELVASGKLSPAVMSTGEQQEKPAAAGDKDHFDERVRQMREKGTEHAPAQRTVEAPEVKTAIDQGTGALSAALHPAEVAPATTAEVIPSITPAELENYWKLTLELLNEYAPTRKLRAFLLVSKPHSVIGDTVYIVFPPTSTFHKENAEKERNFIERALKKVTGMALQVVCIFEGEEPGQAPDARGDTAGAPEQREAGEEMQPAAIEDNPIIQKALKFFGGRVIQVENE